MSSSANLYATRRTERGECRKVPCGGTKQSFKGRKGNEGRCGAATRRLVTPRGWHLPQSRQERDGEIKTRQRLSQDIRTREESARERENEIKDASRSFPTSSSSSSRIKKQNANSAVISGARNEMDKSPSLCLEIIRNHSFSSLGQSLHTIFEILRNRCGRVKQRNNVNNYFTSLTILTDSE